MSRVIIEQLGTQGTDNSLSYLSYQGIIRTGYAALYNCLTDQDESLTEVSYYLSHLLAAYPISYDGLGCLDP